MGYALRQVLTPGRMAWLLRLRDDGPAKRSRGRVAYDCMRLGWTEWDYRGDNDEPIGQEDYLRRGRDGLFDKLNLERITPLGERILEEAGHDRKDV